MAKHMTFNHYNIGSSPIGLKWRITLIKNDYNLIGRIDTFQVYCVDSSSTSHKIHRKLFKLK